MRPSVATSRRSSHRSRRIHERRAPAIVLGTHLRRECRRTCLTTSAAGVPMICCSVRPQILARAYGGSSTTRSIVSCTTSADCTSGAVVVSPMTPLSCTVAWVMRGCALCAAWAA